MGMIYVLATVCFLSVEGSGHLAPSGKDSASLKALLQADSASEGLLQDDSASDELLQADSASDKLRQDDVPSEPSGRNTRRQIINQLKADVLSLESDVGSLKENIADNAKLFYDEINRLDARMDNFHPRPAPTQNAKAEMEQPRQTERKSSQNAAA